MKTFPRGKAENITRNVLISTGLFRMRRGYPFFQFSLTEEEFSNQRHASNVRVVKTWEFSQVFRFTEEEIRELVGEGVSIRHLNEGLQAIQQTGIRNGKITMTIRNGEVNKFNPPHLTILPDWEHFNSEDYAFECRNLLNQDA